MNNKEWDHRCSSESWTLIAQNAAAVRDPAVFHGHVLRPGGLEVKASRDRSISSSPVLASWNINRGVDTEAPRQRGPRSRVHGRTD